jgi:hypothetical protein
MQFRALFNGRKTGAIGITYDINVVIEGDTKSKAIISLWDKYEHISNLKIEECICPSVACPVHGLPPGSSSGGW